MIVKLTATHRDDLAITIEIEPGKCVRFGRTLGDWIFDNDGHMSRLHFEVENFGGTAVLRDCDSCSGTYLNNRHVKEIELQIGDQIRAGTTFFTVDFLPMFTPDEG